MTQPEDVIGRRGAAAAAARSEMQVGKNLFILYFRLPVQSRPGRDRSRRARGGPGPKLRPSAMTRTCCGVSESRSAVIRNKAEGICYAGTVGSY
jgi:hypothetical protein